MEEMLKQKLAPLWKDVFLIQFTALSSVAAARCETSKCFLICFGKRMTRLVGIKLNKSYLNKSLVNSYLNLYLWCSPCWWPIVFLTPPYQHSEERAAMLSKLVLGDPLSKYFVLSPDSFLVYFSMFNIFWCYQMYVQLYIHVSMNFTHYLRFL